MSMTADAAFSIAHFGDAWRALCAANPQARIETAEGLDCIFSKLPIAFFNVAIVTKDEVAREELEAYGQYARQFAAPFGVPWLFLVTQEALARGVDATATLDACGLIPMLALTGMIAHRINPAAGTVDGLVLDVAHDDAACVAAFEINAAAYGVPLEAAHTLYGKHTFWDPHVLAVGRAGTAPVASTAVLDVAGCRYVALVATLPDHQRRGYAEAVMRYALEMSVAKYGDRPTTLHATDAGRPIYLRMGYQPIASHLAFIDKAFLAGH
jgi:GNAT superfamily N-acetyltransferase